MRQISEVAETILTSGLVDAPTSSHEGRFFQLRSSPQSEALNKWRLKQRPLWKAAELKNFQVKKNKILSNFSVFGRFVD
jgi:hypothetical protein